MIKQNSVIKFFITVLAIFLLSNSLFATELKVGIHFDNYNSEGKNIFGASFNIKEFITDEIAINASLQNNKNNNYSAYCAGSYNKEDINFLGGLLFDIRNSRFSPGIIINGDIVNSLRIIRIHHSRMLLMFLNIILSIQLQILIQTSCLIG